MALTFPHEGGASVCEMEVISTPRIRKYLGECSVYATTALDAWGNPVFVKQPLIIRDSVNPMLLPDAMVTAAFLSGLGLPSGSREEARDILLLLADLQSWQLYKNIPDEMLDREESANATWRGQWFCMEEATLKGWVFECVFLTDSIIRHYERFRIVVLKTGEVSIENRESLGRPPGHSGYIENWLPKHAALT